MIEILKPLDDAKPTEHDLQLWSVTTVIGVLDKPALLWWAAEQVVRALVGGRLPAALRRDDRRRQSDAHPTLWLQALYLEEALLVARALYRRHWLGQPDWRAEIQIPALRLALAAALRAERRWRAGEW